MSFLPSPDEAPSGSIVVYGGLFGPPSQAGPLALLGQAAHHWNGGILRFAPNRFLRGQRKKPASLERPSFDCVLAVACSRWDPPYCPRLVVASAGTSTERPLIKRAHYARHPYFHYTRNTVDDIARSGSPPPRMFWSAASSRLYWKRGPTSGTRSARCGRDGGSD